MILEVTLEFTKITERSLKRLLNFFLKLICRLEKFFMRTYLVVSQHSVNINRNVKNRKIFYKRMIKKCMFLYGTTITQVIRSIDKDVTAKSSLREKSLVKLRIFHIKIFTARLLSSSGWILKI
jgi:hypothetical protein